MKLILTMVALLTLVARETAARQTAGYAVGGIGTTSEGPGYNVHVNWTYPGNQTSKGGVSLTESKDGRVVHRVQTDKNTLPTMISVSPDLSTLQVAVWAYVKGFTVKYSSNGTPTLFIDGFRYDGPRDEETLVAALELVSAEALKS